MKYSQNTYKLIKSLGPIDLYEIITRGACSEYIDEIKRHIISTKGEWFLNNWSLNNGINLDVIGLYISDSGFTLWTTKEEAKRIELVFKSWGLFYEVWSRWYGGGVYVVGFNYDYEAFAILHTEWLRDKKLKQIGII